MEVRALGPIEIIDGGEAVSLGGNKPTLLLATLLADVGRIVSADRLELALWGDDPPKSSGHAIQVYVSRLRGTLGDGFNIATEADGYRLELEGSDYDVFRFDDFVESARNTEDPARRAGLLREALGLWRGRPFGSLADSEAIRIEAQRLEMLRTEVTEQLFEAELEAGRHSAVVGEIEEELARSPLREGLWRSLMLGLYRSGRQAEALRAYGRLRSTLVEELGIDPSPESRELENKILLHDRSLDLPTQLAGNLPAAVTSFIGREGEIDALVETLRDNRIVTVHGPPGIGKSRLALELAGSSRDRYRGGCFHVDVTGIEAAPLLEAEIARAFGLEQRADHPLEAVVDRVGVDPVLLLLDGCEHLTDAVHRTVTFLTRRCPELRSLLTTTVALDVEGEAIVRLGPLDHADAQQLFRERARAAGAISLESEDDSVAIALVCERLEGVALAIEVAAARAGMLSPAQILSRLQDPELLGASSTGSGRRTLDAALDWTVGLLSEPVAHSFDRLSVFRDGFDLDAAEGVLGSSSAFEHVTELARHSLLSPIRHGGVVRYRMLDAVRDFATRRLNESGDLPSARQAHAEYFRSWTHVADRGLNGVDQLEWLVRFDADHGNIRAALGFFLDKGDLPAALEVGSDVSWYWFLRAHLREGWYWLGRLLEATDTERTIPRVRALIRASQFAWEQVANDRARAWLEEALGIAAVLDSELHVAWAQAHLALLDVIEGRDEEARGRAVEARQIFEDHGHFIGMGFATFVEALAPLLPAFREDTVDQAEVREVIERVERLSVAAHAVGERNLIGHVEWALGILESVMGDFEAARAHLGSAARNLIELGNLSCLAHVLDALAMLEAASGRAGQAGFVLGMVVALRRQSGTPGHDFEQLLHHRARSDASADIGDRALEERIAEGAAMPLDGVLASAWSAGEDGAPIGS